MSEWKEVLFRCPICGKVIAERITHETLGYYPSEYIRTDSCEHYRSVKLPVCRGFWESDLFSAPYVEAIFYEYVGLTPQLVCIIINKEIERKYFEERKRQADEQFKFTLIRMYGKEGLKIFEEWVKWRRFNSQCR